MRRAQKKVSHKEQRFRHRWRGYLADASPLPWVMAGFAVSYILFFVRPVFLNPARLMQIYEYLPRINPIGADLRQMLSYSESWFIAKETPYIGYNLYPPLASILYTPLLVVDFATAFAVVTLTTIACYLFITLLMPLLADAERKISPLLMLFFITGLSSYGFQFELERGQFNVIAVSLCLLAIWIFHYRHKYRLLAYILFSLSIQLKVFPVIFIVMFIRDWRDWKNNIRRVLGITAANLALLFVLGPPVFVDFLKAVRAQTVNPGLWTGNHSVKSFVAGIMGEARASQAGASEYSSLIQVAILAFIAACILLVVVKAYQERNGGLNAYLLLACTLGALLIPSVSHDYKLSILAAPVALLFHRRRPFAANGNLRLQAIFGLLTFVFCVAYSSTLFSYTNKPALLDNNLPALTVMLFITAAFALLGSGRQSPAPAPEAR